MRKKNERSKSPQQEMLENKFDRLTDIYNKLSGITPYYKEDFEEIKEEFIKINKYDGEKFVSNSQNTKLSYIRWSHNIKVLAKEFLELAIKFENIECYENAVKCYWLAYILPLKFTTENINNFANRINPRKTKDLPQKIWVSSEPTTESIFYAGFRYLTGIGVKKNKEKAKQYFESAGRKGSVDANFLLGVMHDENRMNFFQKNTDYYQKAAKLNHPIPQYLLWKKDPTNFFKNLENSSKENYACAQNELGKYHLKRREFDEAIKCFKKALQGGNAEALSNLGRMYLEGRGFEEKNYENASFCFEQGILKRDLWSHYYLGSMYLQGLLGEKNYDEAIKYFQKVDQNKIIKNKIILLYHELYKHGEFNNENLLNFHYYSYKILELALAKFYLKKNAGQNFEGQYYYAMSGCYKAGNILKYNFSMQDLKSLTTIQYKIMFSAAEAYAHLANKFSKSDKKSLSDLMEENPNDFFKMLQNDNITPEQRKIEVMQIVEKKYQNNLDKENFNTLMFLLGKNYFQSNDLESACDYFKKVKKESIFYIEALGNLIKINFQLNPENESKNLNKYLKKWNELNLKSIKNFIESAMKFLENNSQKEEFKPLNPERINSSLVLLDHLIKKTSASKIESIYLKDANIIAKKIIEYLNKIPEKTTDDQNALTHAEIIKIQKTSMDKLAEILLNLGDELLFPKNANHNDALLQKNQKRAIEYLKNVPKGTTSYQNARNNLYLAEVMTNNSKKRSNFSETTFSTYFTNNNPPPNRGNEAGDSPSPN